jgi:phosphatidylserine/phosphatidylglycerophosphate/cardiolipin synthase-like enzyme
MAMGISSSSLKSPLLSSAGSSAPNASSARERAEAGQDAPSAKAPKPHSGHALDSADSFEGAVKRDGTTTPASAPLPTPAPLPSTPLETLYTDPFHQDVLGDRLAAIIGTAKKTLHGAFYEIADRRMLDAFCAAAKSGVKVQLVTDDNYFRTDETQSLLDRRVVDLGKVHDFLVAARRLTTSDPNASANAQQLLDGFDAVQKALDDAALPSGRAVDLIPAKEYLQFVASGDLVNAAHAHDGLLLVSGQISSALSEYRVRMLFRPKYDQLLQAGVGLRNDDSDKLSHDKYLVIDGKTTWVGSYNIQGLTSDSGDTVGAPNTADNAVVIPSATVAKVFEADFNQMFVDGKFHDQKSPSVEKETRVNGVGVTPYVGPTGTALANLTSDLGTLLTKMRVANSSGKPMSPRPKVRMAAFSSSYNGTEAIFDMLKLLKREGADVRVTADSLGATRQGSGTKELADAGIPVSVTTSDMMLHHKFLSINAGTMQLVWTGSTNFTHPAFFENDETELRLDSADEVKAYEVIFDSLQAHVKPGSSSKRRLLPDGSEAPSGGRPDPLTFDPHSIRTLDDARRYAASLET